MLGIGCRAVLKEIETEPAPALEWIKIAMGIQSGQGIGLALEFHGDFIDFLPGRRHVATGDRAVPEIVCPVGESVAVAVDRNPVGLAVPGADRRLQVAHVIVHVDDVHNPVGHDRGHASAQDIALERCTHLDDVEIHCAGRDRLLKTGVVVRLRKIDPVDRRARIGLPGLQETTEEEVVKVLVVQPHEGQFDARKFTFTDDLLGRAETHFADLLPVRVSGRTHAHAGYLQDVGAQAAMRRCPDGAYACTGRDTRKCRHRACCTESFQHVAALDLSGAFHVIVDTCLHFLPFRFSGISGIEWVPNGILEGRHTTRLF